MRHDNTMSSDSGSLVTCQMAGREDTPLLRGLHGRVGALAGTPVSVRWERGSDLRACRIPASVSALERTVSRPSQDGCEGLCVAHAVVVGSRRCRRVTASSRSGIVNVAVGGDMPSVA